MGTTGSTNIPTTLELKRDGAVHLDALMAAMRAGEPAEGTAAMDAAEAHRQHLTRWFYDCTTEIHRGLGRVYVDDPRFAANYERVAPGLATYLRDAILAKADRQDAAASN